MKIGQTAHTQPSNNWAKPSINNQDATRKNWQAMQTFNILSKINNN